MLFANIMRGLAVLAAIIAKHQRPRRRKRVYHGSRCTAGRMVEGNLEGKQRCRSRRLRGHSPPGYDENSGKRYPVVYFLHGYWATPQMYQNT